MSAEGPVMQGRNGKRRRRTNIDKQEKLVSLLWDVASAAQRNEPEGVVLVCRNTQMGDETMRRALKEIMDVFGYDVLEVQ